MPIFSLPRDVDVNAEIAQRIMGWDVDREGQWYRDPNVHLAEPWGKLPNFLLLASDNELLRQIMQSRGYELTIGETPPDATNGGRTFTACYRRQHEIFQATESNELLAVCWAALKAYGLLPR